MRKKKSEPLLSSEVLQALFENGKSELSIHFLRWKLWKQWPEFVGPTISQNSEPVSYYRGTLYVWVKNSAWMQQLVFMREPMRDAINSKLQKNYVREIRLTMDRRSVPSDPDSAFQLKQSIQSLMSQGGDESDEGSGEVY